ncbi:DUF3616 domain-containing protein [Thiohalocapsa sp. ML1]|uniref:DUF3616 domain-containing protein n=1 Tax=Thiohalocapsa sp. ML1 TaxID=1431688 RepID=UPI0007323004|nr:DUF3616 domain-containing protein [Thiohalocapsa sp. ML1]
MIATPLLQPLLRFTGAADPDRFRDDLSACCFDGRGRLWCASDELTGLSCLPPQPAAASGAVTFGSHRFMNLAPLFDLPDGPHEELDLEGMDATDDAHGRERIWFVGSHTSTRGKPRADEPERKQLKALRDVKRRLNRFLLGYLEPAQDAAGAQQTAQLPIGKRGNALSEALRDDEHLAPFLRCQDAGRGWPQLASKENGFDIEGLAARGARLFLGLRGPVLRGWALLLEVEIDDARAPKLRLNRIGRGKRRYRKHFIHLDGMGVRDLVWHGDDLLILAGPTMDITGRQTLWRLRDAAGLADDSLTARGPALTALFDVPVEATGDKAEGLALWPQPARDAAAGAVLVVYDAPVAARKVEPCGVKADVFALPAAG